VYYQCPSLCSLVLSGVVRAAAGMSLKPGKDYDVIAISFDPRDNAVIAHDKRQAYLDQYHHPETAEGWHFLIGPDSSSKAIADAVGFHYAYDPISNQYAHASGIMVLTPEGRVSRYFYGIDYPARDVKLGLIEASGNTIGSAIDAVQLFCFHYNPATGKYGLLITNVLRLSGIATVGVLAVFMLVMFRRDFRRRDLRGRHIGGAGARV
jgi:protein SCO1/2